MDEKLTQRDRLIRLLEKQTLVRASELTAAGIAATTVSRAVEDGEVIRIGRGLYQLPNSEADTALTLAEASKRVPKGIICMISALDFHGLTDQMPRKVWMAIGAKDWKPSINYPPLRIIRFRPPNLRYGIEHHSIAGTDVPIPADFQFGIAVPDHGLDFHQELRHLGYLHGDVVLVRCKRRNALRDAFPQLPEITRLGVALTQHAIVHQTLGNTRFERSGRLFGLGPIEFQQRVERRRHCQRSP